MRWRCTYGHRLRPSHDFTVVAPDEASAVRMALAYAEEHGISDYDQNSLEVSHDA